MSHSSASDHPTISVIVPIYRVERYLRQCVDSLLNQSYAPEQIILVDDGSDDGCPRICDEYAALHPAVEVIHQVNQGLSAARNAGLDVARCEAIMFVDSDDYVDRDFCKTAADALVASGADLVAFGHRIVNGRGAVRNGPRIVSRTVDQHDAFELLLNSEIGISSWSYAYRAGLFEGLRYPVGHVSEDTYMTPRAFARASRVAVCEARPYLYREKRPGSITTTGSPELRADSLMYNIEMFDLVSRLHPDLAQLAFARLARVRISQVTNLRKKAPVQAHESASWLEQNRDELLANRELPLKHRIWLHAHYRVPPVAQIGWRLYHTANVAIRWML